jgi:molybdopterin-containing oxidoreductase family iron-sulfur binding subunit
MKIFDARQGRDELRRPSRGTDRRSFLARAAAGVAALAGAATFGPLSGRAASSSDEAETAGGPREGDAPRRWGMTIDLDRCTACGACAVACKVENNVPCSGSPGGDQGAAIEWMTMLPAEEGPDVFGLSAATLPLPCMQCDDAPCVKVCPVGATYQTEDGITAQIWDRCIGCRYCQVACPYSRRYFNWKTPEFPESYRNALNPDVATRPAGVVEKCTFCHHRLRDLREEARVQGEVVDDASLQRLTACAEACPAEAITFGDLLDGNSKVSRLSRSPRASRLLENLGTKPKVFYLGRDRSGSES